MSLCSVSFMALLQQQQKLQFLSSSKRHLHWQFFAKISLKLRETATLVNQHWSYLCYLGRCSTNRRGNQQIGLKLLNFSKSCQNSCQGKKCQNIHIKTAQFEGSKHQYQTTFETFEFLLLIKIKFKKKQSKMSHFLRPFQKITMSFQKQPNWLNIAQSGHTV